MNNPSTQDSLPEIDSPTRSVPLSSDRIANLVQSAQQGDSAAIGELLETYRGYLRTIAQRKMASRLGRRLDPSDLVQQTMLEAHQGIDRLLANDDEHLKATLRKILTCNVANAIRDHLFTDKRAIGRECAGSGHLQERPDDRTSPSMTMAKQEEVRQFATLIECLPKDQATAVRMRYFEFASVAEIGEALGRSRMAAAGLLKRGLAELRKSIESEKL
ncbi:sigma-70 family RNA polymerase sigma factor [Novipirellula rosea]|uniref:Sigma-70 family RNA polymerase sigma factor n=1 Tax=Novipirellula rosea TaxID=1031540 RepID=A0ABP8MQF3_9BACT